MQPRKNPYLSFYFVDPAHFHPKSWASLYELIEKYNIPCQKEEATEEWRKKFGRYADFRQLLQPELDTLEKLQQDDLRSYAVHGINVFDCVKSEMLSFLLSQKEWYRRSIPSGNDELFKAIYQGNYKDLLLNMAAGCYWLKKWHEKLPQLEKHTHAIMFSGSKIYSATLLQLLKEKSIIPLLGEHFFTGNDYYLESRYEPVSNNSELALDNIWSGYAAELEGQDKEKLLGRAMLKIHGMKNKNVTQPKTSNTYINFLNNNKTVLILGQVINDFSIIETSREDSNSVFLYKKLINGLLEQTDYNIIFKAHPWERHKLGENAEPVTIRELADFRNEMPVEQADRIFLTEDYNIYSLFSKADYVTTLCSQGAIEAAIYGLKPFIFGNAFYGRRGFTHDCGNVKDTCAAISAAESGLLTLDEYKLLQEFLIIALEKHLISVDDGIKTLERKFNIVKVEKEKPSNKPQKQKQAESKVVDKQALFKRRMKKLMRDPKAFFEDSKHPQLKKLHRYFK